MAPLIQRRVSRKKPQDAQAEEKSVSEATALSPKLIYEVIRREGEEELARSKRSLIWSGIAAGVMISCRFWARPCSGPICPIPRIVS